MDLRRNGLLLDPLERYVQVPGHRGHRIEGLHVQGQPDDRLCLPRQHGTRRPFHLFALAAQAGQGRPQLGRRGLRPEFRTERLLFAATELFGGHDLAPVHPAGPQQAFRALQRDAALGRRYAGTLCQGLPGEGHLPDGLYLLAGHLAGYHRLRHEQHGRRGQRRRDGHQLQPHQAGTQPGDGRPTRRQHDELQSQYLLDRARHGILSLHTART